ncbi:MAG: (4Fe-4S)-binding protein [Cryomorphaceae bacterium]
MSANIVKEYTNGEVTVVWKPNTCIHSEKCWRGLSSVFNPKGRPWVNIEGASTEEIIAQVDKCPSGALSWYKNDVGKPKQETIKVDTVVEVTNNGPILIHGTIELQHPNGSKEKRETTTALCRCGHSGNKPYCDGSHRKNNWTAD